jgi:DNA polymerase-3 subunit delta
MPADTLRIDVIILRMDDSQPTATAEKPRLIILHGDDTFAIERMVNDLRGRVSEDPGMADLNTTSLDGRQASEEDIRTATGSLPFLANRRLVVLAHPFAKLASDDGRSRFLKLLEGLPETTGLVLVVEDRWSYRDRDWEVLKRDNWLIKWAGQKKQQVQVRDYLLPTLAEMPAWIRKEAERQGGKFTQAAAVALAGHLGSEPAQASLEIAKLLMYVDFARPIEAEDVDELTAAGSQVDVFKMVEAMAEGEAADALRMLHTLLEKREAFELFSLVTRQFRQLVAVREILDEGGGEAQVSSELHLFSNASKNMIRQARRFSMADLIVIYHRLVEMDEAAKTSQIPLEVALDTFIAELSRA